MRALNRLTVLCCLAVLVPASAAVAAPTITEFPVSPVDANPLGIAGLSNGTLLFAQGSKNAFGISTQTGSMYSISTLSGPPAGVALSDGYAWMTEPGANRIARVDAFGLATEFSLPGGSNPQGITAGPDGNVWFTEPGGSGAIGKITPTGTITQYTSGLTANSQPTGITAGPDGNLWFTELANPGRIGRITPSGVITEYSAGLTTNSQPTGITAGPDGNVWFTEAANPGAIGWITPQGVISQLATPTANSQPDSITTAANGAIWFTEDGNHGQLGTVTVPPPAVGTASASAVGATTATLTGTVDPNSFTTTYQFAWGTTAAYGQLLPATGVSAGAGSASSAVTELLTGLTPSTTYHFRLVASNCGGCAAGTVESPDATFTTASAPTAGSGSSGTTAAAVMGQSAVVSVTKGTVLVKVRGSRTLQPLTAGRNIPLGSLIDARHGRLNVTTEITDAGRMQTAAVWGGRFVIGQRGTRGMTTFTTATGPLRCPEQPSGDLRAEAVRAHGKTSTTLWSKDNHGRYSTRGHNSVATVRGTVWKTVESCRGTLTFVRKGVVSVVDLHTHRPVLVHQGHSFLATS